MAERKNKSVPLIEIKSESSGRIKTGICAVFGNIDDWGDRMHPGSFAKTISEGRDRVKHLWNHNFNGFPTAEVLELREIGRDELPPEILGFAPEATGGLLVKREYLTSKDADSILECIERKIITEMSFGFDAVKYDYSKEGDREIRELREVKLYDTSDVLWGMNPATLASKSASLLHGLDVDAYFQQFPIAFAEFIKLVKNNEHPDGIKIGRRNAVIDEQTIKSIHQAVKDLGFDECTDKTNDESEKNREAEAVKNDTSLNGYLAVMSLELENLMM